MVIHPAEQQLVRRKLAQIVEGLAVLEQTEELGMVREINLVQEPDANDLPDETQNLRVLALRQIVLSEVDDVAPDRLGRVDDEVLVLDNLERVERADVDGLRMDGVRHGVVDELAEKNTVVASGEQRHRHDVHGQAVGEVGVVAESLVDVVRERDLLLLRERVLGRRRGARNLELVAGLLHHGAHLGVRAPGANVLNKGEELGKLKSCVVVEINLRNDLAELALVDLLAEVAHHDSELVDGHRAVAVSVEHVELADEVVDLGGLERREPTRNRAILVS
eukprot:Amastigsp_a340456_90.p3 type:complete len:278 gc:universal Amastigsp_a340456_90:1150-1983(+)